MNSIVAIDDMLLKIKLLVGILGQAVIDCYLGTRKQRKEAISFFQSSDYPDVVESIKRGGIRFRHVFNLHATWQDIPRLVRENPERVYLNCRVVNFLEGIGGKTILVEDPRKRKVRPVPVRSIRRCAGERAQIVMKIAV